MNGRGRDARNQQDNEEAAKYFEWGLKLNPTCVTCYKNWGEVLMAQVQI